MGEHFGGLLSEAQLIYGRWDSNLDNYKTTRISANCSMLLLLDWASKKGFQEKLVSFLWPREIAAKTIHNFWANRFLTLHFKKLQQL